MNAIRMEQKFGGFLMNKVNFEEHGKVVAEVIENSYVKYMEDGIIDLERKTDNFNTLIKRLGQKQGTRIQSVKRMGQSYQAMPCTINGEHVGPPIIMEGDPTAFDLPGHFATLSFEGDTVELEATILDWIVKINGKKVATYRCDLFFWLENSYVEKNKLNYPYIEWVCQKIEAIYGEVERSLA